MERYAIDLFDGHCDAVFLRYLSGGGLRRNDGHVDLERMGKYRRCAQFFALFGEPEPTPVRDSAGKPTGSSFWRSTRSLSGKWRPMPI